MKARKNPALAIMKAKAGFTGLLQFYSLVGFITIEVTILIDEDHQIGDLPCLSLTINPNRLCKY
jgi:hypothetical protein